MKTKKIVLISCVSKKLPYRTKAKNLYTSTLFMYNIKYAMSLSPDMIFILSAKYGLLELEDEIDTYDETLNTKSIREIKTWADKVHNSLRNKTDLERDGFVFLAGEKYWKLLIPEINNYKIPMQGLAIGRQLKFLKEATK
jgi:glycerophosphoryl diester phosphodiesterase